MAELTLNLDNIDRVEYEDFIESLINKFPGCLVEENLPTLGKDDFDKEGVHTQMIAQIFKPQIEKCFTDMFFKTATCSEGDRKSVARTFSEDELKDENRLFQVRLIHDGRNLEILIKKDTLYLVGYKGKYKEEDGKENAEKWIVLNGKKADEVAESAEKLLPSTSIQKVPLGTSYTKLFGKSDPSFKESAPDSDLYEKMNTKLLRFIEIAQGEEDRNIIYARSKLKEIKSDIERAKGKENEISEDFKRVNRLLDMVPKVITRDRVEELEGIANEAARDFLNRLKKPQEQYIPAGELIKKLKKKYDKYLKQVELQNKAEASENKSLYSNPLSGESLILWRRMFKTKVVILRSLTVGEMDKTYSAKIVRKMSEEVLKKELDVVIKLIRMLQKKYGTGETPKTKATTLLNDFLSKKEMLINLYDGLTEKDKEELAQFYKELDEMFVVLKFMMQSVKADAEIIKVKKHLAAVKLDRQAFTQAVDYLTAYSYNEDEGITADHITKLALMICEAARFPNIKKHVANNYHMDETHDETHGTAILCANCITSVYNWSSRSAFRQRGWVYPGETPMKGEDPSVVKGMEVEEAVTE